MRGVHAVRKPQQLRHERCQGSGVAPALSGLQGKSQDVYRVSFRRRQLLNMLRAVTSSALRKKNPILDCLVDTIVWFCYRRKRDTIKNLRGSHYCEVAFQILSSRCIVFTVDNIPVFSSMLGPLSGRFFGALSCLRGRVSFHTMFLGNMNCVRLS